MQESVDELYTKVAEYYGITIQELKQRITEGEKLIHRYYLEAFDNEIPI